MTDAPEPTEANCASLNKQFYDAQPWIYFQQRLAHLMLVASDGDRYRAIFAEGVTAGGVTLKIDVNPDAAVSPTSEQSFAAVEVEVLLHQSAETLLRYVHAHAEPSPCPWVRMARLTSYRDFKSWVRTTIANARRDELAPLCRQVFACDPNNAEDLDSYIAHLQLFATHFLDADSYNAAKHGMALHGGSERLQVEIDGRELFKRDGMLVSWLACWPRDDAERLPRWTRVSRLQDEGATIALLYTATVLMRSIWIRGRERHLKEPWDEVYRPVTPDQLFDERGIRHHVLADVYRPLPDDGEQESIIIKSAHFEAPSGKEDGAAERPDETNPDSRATHSPQTAR